MLRFGLSIDNEIKLFLYYASKTYDANNNIK